jgi:flagellar basal-body rod modification protein FlgD
MEATGISSQLATTDYLSLLTIQLQNQDPIDPVAQEDFTAQLAQFSQLEGIENLNTSFQSMLQLQEISQGLDLVGKTVDYLDVNTDQLTSGKVDEFYVDGGVVNLVINGGPITVDLISGVRAD